MHGEISRFERRRDIQFGRTLLPQFLFPAALYLQGRAQDGDVVRGMQAALEGGNAVPVDDAAAPGAGARQSSDGTSRLTSSGSRNLRISTTSLELVAFHKGAFQGSSKYLIT